ncbi:Beta-N-acetylhexosaminidase [Hexamita inflata]|uniref:Beta-hexosaminidase n=1 Tax=Hexamita inflata TaxID=28002 RepID=A0ABP1L7J6_9EUKA
MLIFNTLLAITPLPVNYTVTNQSYKVSLLTYTCALPSGADCLSVLQPMINFYTPLAFPSGTSSFQKEDAAISTVIISISTDQPPVDFKSANESYSIITDSTGIKISADNSFGVARALSTLSQIIYQLAPKQYFINYSQILDYPKYPYRAVMVDSSRHFLPLSTLKRQVAALSIAKMSVLHLHESDSQSFPTKTKTEPGSNFVKGAWKTGGFQYYHTLEQLLELATYAKNLGVFIMIEFDMPGHASSWGSADSTIVCACRDVINPVNELTYEYIRTFLKDIFEVLYKPFGFNPMVHLGGDEVNSGCFTSDPKVKSELDKKGWGSKEAWQYLHQRVVTIIETLAKDLYPDRQSLQYRFYWQESFTNGNNLSNGGIMHAWMSTHEIANAAMKEVYSIRSQGWYLDLNQPGGNQEAFVDSWMDFYKIDVTGGLKDEKKKKFVLGGGGCQWGEKVNDGNIDEQIWPRSIAISEVLWSEPDNRVINVQLKQRLNELTCKIRSAGVQSGALIASQPCPGIDDRDDNQVIQGWRGPDLQLGEEDEGWGGRKR